MNALDSFSKAYNDPVDSLLNWDSENTVDSDLEIPAHYCGGYVWKVSFPYNATVPATHTYDDAVNTLTLLSSSVFCDIGFYNITVEVSYANFPEISMSLTNSTISIVPSGVYVYSSNHV